MGQTTIAARIKQARQMAGLKTQAQLLGLIPRWKASRLGNYEAGISAPAAEDVTLIAEATGVSACWLMFGHGPIRPTQRDLQAIRHQNLMQTLHQYEKANFNMAQFASKLAMSPPQLALHIDNPFLPIDDLCAKKLEQFLHKKSGWADEQHIENDPICASFPEDLRELMIMYSSMTAGNRLLSLSLLRAVSAKDTAER